MKYAQDLLFEQIVERATGNLLQLPHHSENVKFMTPRSPSEMRTRRFYHDSSHLVDVWMHLPRHEAADAMFVLFHDYVYYCNGSTGENERESALAFKSFASSWIGIDEDLIEAGIWATGRHFEDQPDLNPRIHGWLDADLSGLGSHPDVYSSNSENVRQEMMLERMDPRWIDGRTKFIDAMLKRNQIFYLKENAHLEHRARSNMEAELRELRLGR